MPALLICDSHPMYSYKKGVHISKFDDIALNNIKPFSLVIIYVCDARKAQWHSNQNVSTGTPTDTTTKFFDETFWYALSALFVNKAPCLSITCWFVNFSVLALWQILELHSREQ